MKQGLPAKKIKPMVTITFIDGTRKNVEATSFGEAAAKTRCAAGMIDHFTFLLPT